MGFKEIKKKLVECIKNGNYDHEIRNNIDIKNIFLIGLLSEDELIEIIKSSNGNQYSLSKHHLDSSVDIHIIKPIKDNKKWYIKFYFLEPNTVFISVHESEG